MILCAIAVALAPPLRLAGDIVVTATCGANAAIVGLALGAYGAPALRWLPHLPFEWAALAAGAALYVDSRARSRAPVPAPPVVAVLLLVVAATVEVHLTPQ